MVCLDCLNDYRLILSNYRCLQCHDEESNREVLRRNLWLINTYKSTNRMMGALRKVFCGPPCLSDEGQPITIERAASGRDRREANGTRLPEHLASPPSGEAQHGTRLPVNWQEVSAASAAGVGKLAGRQAHWQTAAQNVPPAPPQSVRHASQGLPVQVYRG